MEFKFVNVFKLFRLHDDETRAEALRETAVTHNMVSFFGVSGGCGTTTLACNVADVIARSGKTVCVVDMDLRTPSVCSQFCVKYPKQDAGLVRKLFQPGLKIGEFLMDTPNKNLKILSAAISDEMLVSLDVVDSGVLKLFDELSEMFEVVIVDVPRYFELHSTIFSIMRSSIVYTVFGSDQDSIVKHMKSVEFFSSAGIVNKLGNVVINKALPKINYKSVKALKGINVIAEIPITNSIPLNAAVGSLMTEAKYSMDKSAKRFVQSCNFIANEVVYGIEN